MCAMEEQELTVMLESHQGPSQVSLGGMPTVDEELTAMLQSGHHSHSQATLAGVMAPSIKSGTSSGTEHMQNAFPSHYTSLQGSFSARLDSGHGRHLAPSRTVNMPNGSHVDVSTTPSHGGGPPNRSTVPQQQQQQGWAFSGDERWVLEAKNEALQVATNLRVNVTSFGSILESSQALNAPLASGLQRYHSAPTTFLACLAELNEDAFSQVTSPMGNPSSGPDSLLTSLFSDDLTPITENSIQQMDTDKVVTGSSLNDYDQFLSTQNDFRRRAALSASMLTGKPETSQEARNGIFVPDTFGCLNRPMKNSLLRQSSSPADLLAQLSTAMQDSMDESHPGLQGPSRMSPEESLSGGTSEKNGVGNDGKSPIYSRDDSFLVSDTLTSEIWNAQTSPGHLAGKRLRGVPGEPISDTSVTVEGLSRGKIREPGTSLRRHLSLPTNANRPTSPGLDDLADLSVPCRTRAKRGCATHPRSIAERVRRTRISERMKKLQDLVPNMDKQTNTADMLDEAVEYVKFLQQQVQDLSDTVVKLKELKAQG